MTSITQRVDLFDLMRKTQEAYCLRHSIPVERHFSDEELEPCADGIAEAERNLRIIGADNSLAGMSDSAALALTETQARPAVLVIPPLTQYQFDVAEIDEERRQYLADRVSQLLSDRETFAELFYEVTGGGNRLADLAVVALRDAVLEQGRSWDGISAFGDLMHAAARAKAAGEWPRVLLASAPECSDCHYGKEQRDHYGTGDSPTVFDCRAAECPWGKR